MNTFILHSQQMLRQQYEHVLTTLATNAVPTIKHVHTTQQMLCQQYEHVHTTLTTNAVPTI